MFETGNPLDTAFVESLTRLAVAQEEQTKAIKYLASSMAQMGDTFKEISRAFEYNYTLGKSRLRVDLWQHDK